MSAAREHKWREHAEADAATLTARAWNSDLLAAFGAARSYYARTYGDRLREAYGDEWLKVLTQAFEVYAALIDAGAEDEDEARQKSAVRRFELPAWRAAQFLTRRPVPYIADPDEFARVKQNLTRAWSRYGFRWVHKFQCVTGDELFKCDTIGFQDNADATPAHYTDNLNDLLSATIRLFRQGRSRARRVNKFAEAFAEALRAARRSGAVPRFAEKWEPPPVVDAEAARLSRAFACYRAAPRLFLFTLAAAEDAARPFVKARDIMRRAALRAAAMLPEGEREAFQIEAHAILDEVWEGEEETPPPPAVPPVSKRRTAEKSAEADAPESATSRASAQGEAADFGRKNEETGGDRRTFLTYEYEPEAEPRGTSLAEAEAACTLCASVGVERVKIVLVDDTKPKGAPDAVTHARGLTLAELQSELPHYITRNARAPVESLTVRLHFKGDTRLIQTDDCSPEVCAALAPFSFMQAATSPGNAQAWLCLADELSEREYAEVRRRYLKRLEGTGANGGAYGSIRWPGSMNRKPGRRYSDGASPRVQLLLSAPGRRVTVAELDAAGLLAPPEPKPTPRQVRDIKGRIPSGWPDLEECYAKYGSDRSRAEFVWCMKALRKGWPEHHVEAELSRVGAKAVTRQRDDYIAKTVENAARAILGDISPARASAEADPHEVVTEVF